MSILINLSACVRVTIVVLCECCVCVSVTTLTATYLVYTLKTRLFMVFWHCVDFVENVLVKRFGDIC